MGEQPKGRKMIKKTLQKILTGSLAAIVIAGAAGAANAMPSQPMRQYGYNRPGQIIYAAGPSMRPVYRPAYRPAIAPRPVVVVQNNAQSQCGCNQFGGCRDCQNNNNANAAVAAVAAGLLAGGVIYALVR